MIPRGRSRNYLGHWLKLSCQKSQKVLRSQELQDFEQKLESCFASFHSFGFVSIDALGLARNKEEHLVKDVVYQLVLCQEFENHIIGLLLVIKAEDVSCGEHQRFKCFRLH